MLGLRGRRSAVVTVEYDAVRRRVLSVTPPLDGLVGIATPSLGTCFWMWGMELMHV